MSEANARRLGWSTVALSALLTMASIVIAARSGSPTGTFEIPSLGRVGTQIAGSACWCSLSSAR